MKPKDSLENLTRVDEQPLNSGHDTGDHDESPMQQWQWFIGYLFDKFGPENAS